MRSCGVTAETWARFTPAFSDDDHSLYSCSSVETFLGVLMAACSDYVHGRRAYPSVRGGDANRFARRTPPDPRLFCKSRARPGPVFLRAQPTVGLHPATRLGSDAAWRGAACSACAACYSPEATGRVRVQASQHLKTLALGQPFWPTHRDAARGGRRAGRMMTRERGSIRPPSL